MAVVCVLEAARLRVQDIGFDYKQIMGRGEHVRARSFYATYLFFFNLISRTNGKFKKHNTSWKDLTPFFLTPFFVLPITE